MGSLARIVLYAASPDEAQQAFVLAFRRIEELNAILSDYDPQSELSRFCSSAEAPGPDLSAVLNYSQQLARETNGAFDITSGPLTRLWREARREKRLPTEAQIREARKRTGYRKLKHGRCGTRGMQLDVGGIAKGYAADQAIAVLKRAGITSALVAMSGDIVVSGSPPGKPGWTIQHSGQVEMLANAAVSTSGDEFQFLEVNGIRYSHIIDPRTGYALQDTVPVSVVARTGMEADAIATAVSVDRTCAARLEKYPGVRIAIH